MATSTMTLVKFNILFLTMEAWAHCVIIIIARQLRTKVRVVDDLVFYDRRISFCEMSL